MVFALRDKVSLGIGLLVCPAGGDSDEAGRMPRRNAESETLAPHEKSVLAEVCPKNRCLIRWPRPSGCPFAAVPALRRGASLD